MTKLKITINTNIKYGKSLSMLLWSMINKGYKDFKDVIIVVSGYKEETKEPFIGKIGEIFPENELPDIECCIILTEMENWEYTAYHMLYVYREHPLVKSERYISLMDTCIVDKTFAGKINKLKEFVPENAGGAWIYGCKGIRVSNMYLFSREVVLNYKNNFETLVNKVDAVLMESGGCVENNGVEVCGIHNFGEFFDCGHHKRRLAAVDIYDTGYPRTPFFFEFLGVTKYIMLMWHGDMIGKLEKIDLPESERIKEREGP